MYSFSSLQSTVFPDRSDFKRRVHLGSIHNRKLLIVCAKCNNEWMSALQLAAKPYLLPLIQGDGTALDATGQEIIAAWIAMTVIVAEFYKKRVTSTAPDRQFLRKNKRPSDQWKIRIGNFERGNWGPHLVHSTFPISYPGWRPKFDDVGLPRPNTQTTEMTVGKLYILAASTPTDIFEQWRVTANGARKLAQIWPFRRNIIGWPPEPLTDREADDIAGAFFRFTEEIGRRTRLGL